MDSESYQRVSKSSEVIDCIICLAGFTLTLIFFIGVVILPGLSWVDFLPAALVFLFIFAFVLLRRYKRLIKGY